MLYKGGPHFIPYVQYHKVYYSLPALEISELIFLSLYINILLSRILFRINIKREKEEDGKKMEKMKISFHQSCKQRREKWDEWNRLIFQKNHGTLDKSYLTRIFKKKIILKFILSFWLMTEMLKKRIRISGLCPKKERFEFKIFRLEMLTRSNPKMSRHDKSRIRSINFLPCCIINVILKEQTF